MARRTRALALLLATPMVAAPAAAQTGVEWVEFQPDVARLPSGPTLTSTNTEIDFAVGDLDRDGWPDVAAVRKSQGSTAGKRTNVLLLNDAGTLRDVTASLAVASDVPGDLGFLTPTNDRDLVLADLDGDGWLDLVTATTLSDGDPKHISHPRVYMNLGQGPWLGLRHEDARVPQLFTSGGLPVAPRFCDVTAGDFDMDGALDLHFVDYDNTQTGLIEAAGEDLNDRVLVNDGNGFFSDQSTALLTTTQLQSAFGLGNCAVDLNLDGTVDILKMTSLGFPYELFAYYNLPGTGFPTLGANSIYGGSGYGFDCGDLNNDGRPDVVIQDDGNDRFRLNQSTDVFGRAVFGGVKQFQFAGGSDDGFGHKVRIADLDNDDYADVLICDGDIEFAGCTRRLHIYHNLGTTPGENVDLREEAELASGDKGAGWKGVVGMTVPDMRGTFDVGTVDADRDGDLDMLVARCDGTLYWENRTVVCQDDLGYQGPGNVTLSLCGDDLAKAGNSATISVEGTAPGALVAFAMGFTANPTPLFGGTLVPNPFVTPAPTFFADGAGALSLPLSATGASPATFYMQAAALSGSTIELSNALAVEYGF